MCIAVFFNNHSCVLEPHFFSSNAISADNSITHFSGKSNIAPTHFYGNQFSKSKTKAFDLESLVFSRLPGLFRGHYLTISFRFSQGWRAYSYHGTTEYANCDHEYLFVAIPNVTCVFSAFSGWRIQMRFLTFVSSPKSAGSTEREKEQAHAKRINPFFQTCSSRREPDFRTSASLS